MKRTTSALVLIVALLMWQVGMVGPLTTQVAAQDVPIRVGSKWFPENAILGQMIILALQDAGYVVEDHTNFGNTQANRVALLRGELDVYPEYTGTALTNFFNDLDWLEITNETARNGYLSYATVSALDAAINDMVWLQPAPANNTFALIVTREFSETHGVATMEDFARYVNEGGNVMFATSEEFSIRPDGLPSFETTYGFDLKGEQMLVIVGVTPAETEAALSTGVNDINLAMAYSTDGALIDYDFVVLADDLYAQPIYQPAPVFRGEVVRNYPDIVGILQPIFLTLDEATLQELNRRVETGGETERAVALSYLESQGFVSAGSVAE